jgi:hypothetical protein
MDITFADPPFNPLASSRKPVVTPFLQALMDQPNRWAIFPTKTVTKHIYVVAFRLRAKAREMNLVIDTRVNRENDVYTLYVRITSILGGADNDDHQV